MPKDIFGKTSTKSRTLISKQRTKTLYQVQDQKDYFFPRGVCDNDLDFGQYIQLAVN